MSIFGEKTAKVVSASGAPPPNPRLSLLLLQLCRVRF